MSNHIHLLMTEPEENPLSTAIQVLKQRFSRTRSEEFVWEARYHDFNVFTESKKIEKLHYMHRNPIKAGHPGGPSFRFHRKGGLSNLSEPNRPTVPLNYPHAKRHPHHPPAPSQTLPPNYTTILENQTFRIIRVHYGPHEKVPVHDHPDTPPSTSTSTTPAPSASPTKKGTAPNPLSSARPPTPEPSASARACSSATPSKTSAISPPTSSASNSSEPASARKPSSHLEFRGPAPADLTHNLTATEFSSPKLTDHPNPLRRPDTLQTPSHLRPIRPHRLLQNHSQRRRQTHATRSQQHPRHSHQPTLPIAAPAHILQITFAAH